MAKWAANIYDTLKDAETAIEAIDSDTELRMIAFKEGVLQKVLVAQGDLKSIGKLQIATTTEDLNQGIGSYDLLTGTTQSVILEKLIIRMPTEAAGGSITTISIQTDDVTPSVIINSTDGAVANLTSEAQLAWTGAIEIPVGTKIQLSITGGAHGTTYTTTIIAQCSAVVSGGYLA